MTKTLRQTGDRSGIPNPGDVIATVRDHDELAAAFHRMKELLGLTNAHCDELANMTSGHTDKMIGPSRTKDIGALSFGRFCWLFAVKFEMRIDLDQAKIMAEHWEDRQRLRPPQYSENSRISKKLIEKAKPHVFSEMGKRSAAKRMECTTVEHRSKIARKAARARWGKKRQNRKESAPAIAADRISRSDIHVARIVRDAPKADPGALLSGDQQCEVSISDGEQCHGEGTASDRRQA